KTPKGDTCYTASKAKLEPTACETNYTQIEPKTLVQKLREVPTVISQENTSLIHKFKKGNIGLPNSKVRIQIKLPSYSLNEKYSGNPEPGLVTTALKSLQQNALFPQIATKNFQSVTNLHSDNRSQVQPFPPTVSENIPRGLSKALKHFKNQLTLYEQREIKDYKELWFLGLGAKKIDGYIDAQNSSTYDDDHGSYKKCLDHKTGEKVAVKIIRNKKRFHNQALVEVDILNSLRQKDQDNTYNVVHMKEYFCFRNHFCISFELLGLNLYELIKKNNFQGFTLGLIRRFTHCILRCLQLLYTEKIIHCDLKPENILISQSSAGQIAFKVIDFGSSCYEHQRVYTYVQSRFYRSPEVILGHPYTTSIDMWSLGCIIVELYTGCPLFPGENEILGLPPSDFIQTATRKRTFFDLSVILKTYNGTFLDFLKKCLVWKPSLRMIPEEAIHHAWMKEPWPPRLKQKPKMVTKPMEATFYTTEKKKENGHKNTQLEKGDEIARQQSGTEVKTNPPEKLPVSHQKLSPVALSEEINKEENQSSVKQETPTKEAEPPVDKVAKREHRPGKVLRKNTSILPPIKYKQLLYRETVNFVPLSLSLSPPSLPPPVSVSLSLSHLSFSVSVCVSVSILGLPPSDFIQTATRKRTFFEITVEKQIIVEELFLDSLIPHLVNYLGNGLLEKCYGSDFHVAFDEGLEIVLNSLSSFMETFFRMIPEEAIHHAWKPKMVTKPRRQLIREKGDEIARQQSGTEVKTNPPEKLPVSHQKLSPVALSEEINKEENQSSVKQETPTKEAEPPVDKVAKREHRPGKVLRKNTSILPPIKYK
ncbi:hypothetical protein E2320_005889, partial [Naja naja]